MKISLKSIYQWYRNAIRHPKYRWWVILATLVYLISPLDLSPDIFPIAGQIDDVMIVSLLLTEISQVAFEYFKSLKQQSTSSTASEQAENTVEVEAVSVE